MFKPSGKGTCICAEEEGGTDTTVVRKVLQFAAEDSPVVVLANDTDILVILLYHLSKDMEVYMKRSNVRMISIQAGKMTADASCLQMLCQDVTQRLLSPARISLRFSNCCESRSIGNRRSPFLAKQMQM